MLTALFTILVNTFIINFFVHSQDKDTEDKDNKAKLSVTVKFEADVEIKGYVKYPVKLVL